MKDKVNTLKDLQQVKVLLEDKSNYQDLS